MWGLGGVWGQRSWRTGTHSRRLLQRPLSLSSAPKQRDGEHPVSLPGCLLQKEPESLEGFLEESGLGWALKTKVGWVCTKEMPLHEVRGS